MKLNRTYLFVSIPVVALVVVLIIQVNWIFQTAKIKEQMFNEKANMVLTRTAEALAADTATYDKIGTCMEADGPTELKAILGKEEVRKIDSLFTHYMRFYNFHIDYSFKVIKPNTSKPESENNNNDFTQNQLPGNYVKSLQQVANENGLELKLILPDKTQFIMAEMGVMFAASVVLILVVLVLFWKTISSLLEEKKIAELTTDFLNNMTHELKTPLANIALAGKMIIKDSNIKQEDKIKNYTGIILEENEKLRLQVEQVLSIAALERGEIPVKKEEIDFHQLIREAVRYMSLQLEQKKMLVKLDLSANSFVIMGDKTHLTNALCNLIDNALKYSATQPELSIATSNVDSNFICTINDNGIGIEKEYHKKVFDKFFRVPTGDVHNVKGFGLGLAYIKKIVVLHSGTITVSSETGKGTSFTITLPNA
jgi:two-component system phosphate regulon sensor histidine kinase PhoR